MAAEGKAIGVRWDPRWGPEQTPAVARLVEELCFDELWMVEDCFSSGGLTTASVALACSERLAVGIGLLPAVVRNPAIAAMEIGALARTFPGRFMPAFGHGVDAWMRQIDARPQRRLKLLEETVATVRALVGGERLDTQGEFVKLEAVELEHRPPQPPPVLVGTTGPRGLALAGRVADGIVIPEVATPAAVSWARGLAAASGGPGRTVVYSYHSLARDAAAGLAAARPLVERWLRSGDFPDMAERAGLGRDGTAEIDDATLRSIAVAGDPAGGAETVRGLWEAGGDAVVLLPRGGDWRRQLELFAEEVMPEVRR
jgi:alkanesulfonate monooxygenase SsuD/methylene tetrahydromethanopterin reductase-like flavin-dependent oxidoreductase (luciferase family)